MFGMEFSFCSIYWTAGYICELARRNVENVFVPSVLLSDSDGGGGSNDKHRKNIVVFWF